MRSKLTLNGGDSGEPLLPRSRGEETPRRRRPSGVLVACAYMLCAVLLVMFNKAALSSYNFSNVNVITLMQLLCATCLLTVLVNLRAITLRNDHAVGGVGPRFVPLKTMKLAAPVGLAYLIYMVPTHTHMQYHFPSFIRHQMAYVYVRFQIVGMAALRGVNIPIYATLRRTTVAFTMTAEYILARKKHSWPVIGSVAVMVAGALLAGLRDLSFDAYSYGVVILSNATTAVYVTATGLNSFGLMWVNCVIATPLLFTWCMFSGELSSALSFQYIRDTGFQLVIFCSCVLAFALNYTVFLNTAINSALTQSVSGNLKDVGTVLFGWFAFGGLPFDPVVMAGILLSFAGSVWYAVIQLR
eukprot:jgi/Chlat1/5146/Chrsp33S05141